MCVVCEHHCCCVHVLTFYVHFVFLYVSWQVINGALCYNGLLINLHIILLLLVVFFALCGIAQTTTLSDNEEGRTLTLHKLKIQ